MNNSYYYEIFKTAKFMVVNITQINAYETRD